MILDAAPSHPLSSSSSLPISMEAPGDSWKDHAFVCDICGENMPFSKIEEHKRTAHSDIMALARSTSKQSLNYFLKRFIPLTIIFAVYLMAIISSNEETIGTYVMGGIIVWSVIAMFFVFKSERFRKAYYDAEKAEPKICAVCGAKVPFEEFNAHDRTMHPRHWQTFKITIALMVLIIILFSVIWYFLYPFVQIPENDIFDFIGWIGIGGLIGFFVGTALIAGYLWPKLVEKAEREWCDEHPGWRHEE